MLSWVLHVVWGGILSLFSSPLIKHPILPSYLRYCPVTHQGFIYTMGLMLLFSIAQLIFLPLPNALFSWGRCSKNSQIWLFATIETYSCMVLGPGPEGKRCQQGHTISTGSGWDSVPCFFQLLVILSIPWLVAASIQSLPLLPYPPWILCLPHLFLIRTPATEFRAHLGNPGSYAGTNVCKDPFCWEGQP